MSRVPVGYPGRLALLVVLASPVQGHPDFAQQASSMSQPSAQVVPIRVNRPPTIDGVLDIVVFDLGRLRDNATILNPAAPSTGIENVLINGTFVVEESVPVGSLPGRVLRRTGS